VRERERDGAPKSLCLSLLWLTLNLPLIIQCLTRNSIFVQFYISRKMFSLTPGGTHTPSWRHCCRQWVNTWLSGCQRYAPTVLYPQEHSWYSIRADPAGHSASGRIRGIEEPNDLIGNWTRNTNKCMNLMAGSVFKSWLTFLTYACRKHYLMLNLGCLHPVARVRLFNASWMNWFW
jgi:hypothetical protein